MHVTLYLKPVFLKIIKVLDSNSLKKNKWYFGAQNNPVHSLGKAQISVAL